jgi:hypothetical protein
MSSECAEFSINYIGLLAIRENEKLTFRVISYAVPGKELILAVVQ